MNYLEEVEFKRKLSGPYDFYDFEEFYQEFANWSVEKRQYALNYLWPGQPHRFMREQLGYDRILNLFKSAEFDIPEFLGNKLSHQVWRGHSNATSLKEAVGPAWSLKPEIAAWHAMKDNPPNPLVVTTEIPSVKILHFFDSEDEVIIDYRSSNFEAIIWENVERWRELSGFNTR